MVFLQSLRFQATDSKPNSMDSATQPTGLIPEPLTVERFGTGASHWSMKGLGHPITNASRDHLPPLLGMQLVPVTSC